MVFWIWVKLKKRKTKIKMWALRILIFSKDIFVYQQLIMKI